MKPRAPELLTQDGYLPILKQSAALSPPQGSGRAAGEAVPNAATGPVDPAATLPPEQASALAVTSPRGETPSGRGLHGARPAFGRA